MVKVVTDEAVRLFLERLGERTEIRDDSGRLVGYFVPADDEDSALRARVRAGYDPAEIARRKAAGEPGRTTAEVLDRLRSPGRP